MIPVQIKSDLSISDLPVRASQVEISATKMLKGKGCEFCCGQCMQANLCSYWRRLCRPV